MNNLRTAEVDASLEKTLSRARLKKYLACCGDDLAAALSAYERNTRLSEAFYTPLQCVEICLRNTLYTRMADLYGSDWMTNDNPPLSGSSKAMIQAALTDLQKDSDWPSNDAIVSELKFAFWVGLLGPGYDQTVWRKTLYKGFFGKKRSFVHGRFNAIRRFRNRVAHHEPIFQKKLEVVHSEIVEAISWMCANTSTWATHHSRFAAVFAAP